MSAVPCGDLVPNVTENVLEELTKYRPATFSYIFHPPHSHLLGRPYNYESRNDQQPSSGHSDYCHTAPQCPEHGPPRTEAACLS